ncbi:MAG: discoidin domain-containing protein [Actinobacteria bacterium]|nr:discoidin domain-containing protein [Actinomycetota bacterium]
MRGRSFRLIYPLTLVSIAASAVAAPPFQQDAGPNAIVCVEAEHYDKKVDMGTNTWSLVTTAAGFTGAGFSGGQAMQIMPDTPLGGRSFATNYVTNSPHLDFQVNFVKTGTYYVWLLAFGRDGNSDSAHVGLDGKPSDASDNLSGWNNVYRWRNTTMEGPRSTLEVTEVGVHTLNLYMREDGTVFDKVLLTTNPDYTPTAFGPAESPRGIPDTATSPMPAESVTDIPRDVILSWTGGPSAVAQQVYFSSVFADVNTASRTDSRGVLVSQAQDANTYDPAGVLDFGTTYYWRVDEVNAPPSSTIFRGNVWSFTTETLTNRVTTITATASSFEEGFGPENTVNGSGLANNLHSTANTASWVSGKGAAQPTWIQFAFARVYKLYEMRVWNYNVVFEPVLGFGFKDVTVEYSTDGTTWTLLKEAQFARAPGLDGYAVGTTVDFAGTAAQYVRLTPKNNWGGLVQQFGLSEVRFYYIPVNPRQPVPASGAKGVNENTVLNWRAGREAASHQVYFGMDPNAVRNNTAPVKTAADHSFDPGPLAFGKTYYWKVAEVNEAATPKIWEGDVWSFSTREAFVVDDFEGYTDTEGSRIYEAWVDGWTNSTGSTVGYVQAPFAERTIIHGGKQSMPLDYNNTKSPFYSEAERTFDTPQDWTANGADTLTLYFRGNPTAFAEAAGTITMSGAGTDIWNAADQFRFAGKQLNGDGAITAKVESIDNTDAWAKCGVMIRESLDPGSRFAAVYATPGNGVRYQARTLNQGTATSDTSVATTEQKALKTPVWIKVERKGSSFSGFYSTDGVTWTAMSWNPQTINMGASVRIGLAVTGHDSGTAAGVFSSISTTGNVSGAWQVEAIGVAQPANDAAPLYVVVEDNAGKSKVITHPDPAATTRTTWQAWRIPLSDLSGIKLTAVKKLTIGVGDQANPKPDGAGKLFLDDIGVGHPAAANP